MANAGVIGLGHIGSGVALCLARAGMLTAVYDVRQDASEGLEGVPAVAPTAAEVARQCDVVLIAVVNAQQTIDVLNRSEERRVGKECVSTCRSRWSPYHYKKKDTKSQKHQQ